MASAGFLSKGNGPSTGTQTWPSTAPSSSRTSFSTAFNSPSSPASPEVLQGVAEQEQEQEQLYMTSLELPSSPVSPSNVQSTPNREPKRQGLFRSTSNKLAKPLKGLRSRTSMSAMNRNQEDNAGPPSIRTRSGSRTFNDGALDVSDLELDGADDTDNAELDFFSGRTPNATSLGDMAMRPIVERDRDGQPVMAQLVKTPMAFTKYTKRKVQNVSVCLDTNLKKLVWSVDGQSSRNEVHIDDVTEIRTGKLARPHVEEFIGPREASKTWISIIYFDPAARGQGRSTHALHLNAKDGSTSKKSLSTTLKILIKDRRDMIAGVSGNTDDEQSLTRLWIDALKRKYGGLVPSDSNSHRLTREDMKQCCQRCLIFMEEGDYMKCFTSADNKSLGNLDKAGFIDFFRSVNERRDLRKIFDEHKDTKTDLMPRLYFRNFLTFVQGFDLIEAEAFCIEHFHKYTSQGNSLGIFTQGGGESPAQDHMDFAGFQRFFIEANAPLSSSKSNPVLNRPLNEYFISSSHNTYLTGWQTHGQSSTEPYVDCLKQGCRCVEIDCWDGDNGQPKVTHGKTPTTSISFTSVIKAISLWAFRASPYPLIISLEVHCNANQQRRMAEIMKHYFGRWLLRGRIPTTTGALPTPEELKGKILIKVKEPMQPQISSGLLSVNNGHRRTRSKSEADAAPTEPENEPSSPAEARAIIRNLPLQPSPTDYAPKPPTSLANTASSDETESDDEIAATKDKKSKTSKIVKELGDLGVYTRGIKFSDFNSEGSSKLGHVYSFNENTFSKKCQASQIAVEVHNRDHLMRVYPKGTRISSRNFDPLPFWRHGVQMVATNWQIYDLGTQINDAMFAHGHDRSGYVLKPEDMRDTGKRMERLPERTKKIVRFSVKIISARHLSPPSGTSAINPYIAVEIFSADNPTPDLATAKGGVDASGKRGKSGVGMASRRRTEPRIGNGWNPTWEEHIGLRLETAYPSLVFVRFTAMNAPDATKLNDQKEPLGAHTAKLGSLQQGYHLLHLRDRRGDNTISQLLVKIDKEDEQDLPASSKASREQSPDSPRISDENTRKGRGFFRSLLKSRASSERRPALSVANSQSGIISRTTSIEK